MATALDSFYPFIGQTLTNAQWQQYLLLFSTDGVRQTLNSTSALAVVQRGAGANKSVDVSAGRLLLQGNLGENSTTKNLVIADNASGNPRIDRVVVRITSATPTIQLDILQGTPAGVPVAPTLTQTAATYEISLAQIAVANGFASILTANITDERAWASAQAIRVPTTPSATALPYPSFTSAVPIVVLPVSGTTNITSIPAAPAGSILILEFQTIGCVVTSGSNLALSRDYNSTSSATGSTLTLQSTGALWVEVARSGERTTAHTFLGNNGSSTGIASFGTLGAADFPASAAWTFTSLTQSGSLAPTVGTSRYWQFGKLAVVYWFGTITAAGTGANDIVLTVPAALTSSGTTTIAGQSLGTFVYDDKSVTRYEGSVILASTTTLKFQVSSNTGFLGTTPNFAAANTDTLTFTAQWELA